MWRPRELLRTARDIIARNLGLKVLALAVSVGLWWFITGERKVQVGFSVPLEIRNIPAGMAIVNRVTDRVDVRVAGPAALVTGIREKDVTAEIDLSGRGEGRGTIYLNERSIRVPAGVRVQRIDPNAVEVALARLSRRKLPVVARLGASGQAKRRVARVDVDPAAVEVEALPEEFARMATLETEEIVPDPPEGVFTTRARVELTEKHAKIVGNPTVRVTVVYR